MTDWNDTRPNEYWTWPKEAQYRYDERICILRESNRVPDQNLTPTIFIQIATRSALDHVF